MNDGVERLLQRDDSEVTKPRLTDAERDYLMVRRAALIMELRGIDRILVEDGTLKEETLERRIR